MFFSVIADKATDVANFEQLSISMCIVDGETVCEKFLAFLKWEKGVTGEALADIHVQFYSNWLSGSFIFIFFVVKHMTVQEWWLASQKV